MLPITQAALLEAQGFRIVPTNGKIATEPGFGAEFPDATWGAEHFGDDDCRVAILAGPCPALGATPAAPAAGDWLLILDLDGPWEKSETLVEFLECLPPTLTSHAARHRFFRVPPSPERDCLKAWVDVFSTKSACNGAALDLRWCGGYACEAPDDWAAGTDTEHLADAIATLPAMAAEIVVAAATAGDPARHRGPRLADGGRATLEKAGFDYAQVMADAADWLRSKAAPRAVRGNGHASLLVIFGALLVGFGLEDDDARALAEDVWNPLIDDPWDGDELDKDFSRKIDEIDRMGSDRFSPLELAYAARNPREFEAARAARVADAEARGEHPSEDLTGCKLCPRTGWPWILQKDGLFWLHEIDRDEYHHVPVCASELITAVSRRLHNVIGPKERSLKELREIWICKVDQLEGSYVEPMLTYDKEGGGTLRGATLRWRNAGGARFHPHVDAWLRALAGDMHGHLEQWLAALCALNRPAPCLYLIGHLGIGKGLLADGIAQLWHVESPGKMAEAIAGFNEAMVECPLVWGDEGFPEKMNFDWFREIITSRSQRINLKHMRKFSVKGCARLMICANNDEGLRFQRMGTLTQVDQAAIASRLLVIDARPRESEIKAILEPLDKYALARHELAEHALWLHANRPLTPETERMAARPANGHVLLNAIAAGRSTAILELIREDMLTEGGVPGFRRDPLTWTAEDEPDALFVSVQRIWHRLRTQDDNRLSQMDVRNFCSTYELRSGIVRKHLDGEKLRLRALKLEAILDALELLD